MAFTADAIGQYAQTVRDEDMHHKMNSSSISLLDSTAPDTRCVRADSHATCAMRAGPGELIAVVGVASAQESNDVAGQDDDCARRR
jgi:hypothetical protein